MADDDMPPGAAKVFKEADLKQALIYQQVLEGAEKMGIITIKKNAQAIAVPGSSGIAGRVASLQADVEALRGASSLFGSQENPWVSLGTKIVEGPMGAALANTFGTAAADILKSKMMTKEILVAEEAKQKTLAMALQLQGISQPNPVVAVTQQVPAGSPISQAMSPSPSPIKPQQISAASRALIEAHMKKMELVEAQLVDLNLRLAAMSPAPAPTAHTKAMTPEVASAPPAEPIMLTERQERMVKVRAAKVFKASVTLKKKTRKVKTVVKKADVAGDAVPPG